MRYRKLSPLGDYTFGNGSLDFYFNVPAAVGQAVQTGLLLWQGEWFLDTSVGMPWIQGVLGKQTQAVADGTIQNQVVNTQGVTDISSYESEFDTVNRTMDVALKIDTIYGPTQVDIANQKIF